MTEGYWKIFCVSHSQLALWCNFYDGYNWWSIGLINWIFWIVQFKIGKTQLTYAMHPWSMICECALMHKWQEIFNYFHRRDTYYPLATINENKSWVAVVEYIFVTVLLNVWSNMYYVAFVPVINVHQFSIRYPAIFGNTFGVEVGSRENPSLHQREIQIIYFKHFAHLSCHVGQM